MAGAPSKRKRAAQRAASLEDIREREKQRKRKQRSAGQQQTAEAESRRRKERRDAAREKAQLEQADAQAAGSSAAQTAASLEDRRERQKQRKRKQRSAGKQKSVEAETSQRKEQIDAARERAQPEQADAQEAGSSAAQTAASLEDRRERQNQRKRKQRSAGQQQTAEAESRRRKERRDAAREKAQLEQADAQAAGSSAAQTAASLEDRREREKQRKRKQRSAGKQKSVEAETGQRKERRDAARERAQPEQADAQAGENAEDCTNELDSSRGGTVDPESVRRFHRRLDSVSMSIRGVCACCGEVKREPLCQRGLNDDRLDIVSDTLSRHGYAEDGCSVNLCKSCTRALDHGDLPDTALKNNLCPGDMPPEFEDLTIAEKMVISPYFVVQQTVHVPRTRARQSKGHCISIPQDVHSFYQSLPLTPQQLNDKLIVTRSGGIADVNNFPELKVRGSKVRAVLSYLMEHSAAFREAGIQVNEDALGAYEEDNVPGVLSANSVVSDGSHGDDDDDDNAHDQSSETDDRAGEAAPPTAAPCADVPGMMHYGMLTTQRDRVGGRSQLQNAINDHARPAANGTGSAPTTVNITVGDRPVSESDPLYFPLSFPYLFPNGTCGFAQPREVSVSLQKYIAHLVMLPGGFACDERFVFAAWNILARSQIRNGISGLSVRPGAVDLMSTLAQLCPEDFQQDDDHDSDADDEDLEAIAGELPDAATTATRANARRNVSRCIRIIESAVRGSDEFKRQGLRAQHAMISTHGLPALFLTVSSADTHWGELQQLCRQYDAACGVEQAASADEPSYQQRVQAVRTHPLCTVLHFQDRFKAFLDVLLPSLGTVAYHFELEFQARGALHAHGVVWLKDAPSIVAVLNHEQEERQRMAEWFGMYVSEYSPVVDGVEYTDRPPGDADYLNKHPCTRRAPVADGDDALKTDLVEMLHAAQIHSRHGPWCMREDKGGVKRCRFGFPRKCRSDWDIVWERQAFRVVGPRNNPLLNNYNATLISAFRANVDSQALIDVRAVMVYLTKYISKPEATNALLLQVAREALERISSNNPKSLLARIANMMLGRRQFGMHECLCHILQLPLRFSSETIQTLWVSDGPEVVVRHGESNSVQFTICISEATGSKVTAVNLIYLTFKQ